MISGTTRDTPVNTVWVELQNTTITSHMTTNSLRAGTLYFGNERLGFSHKDMGTHSIRSGFAMELYLAEVYPENHDHGRMGKKHLPAEYPHPGK